ncbi:MAG: DNA polymerase III subunit delta [Nitrospirota bacterium]
MEEYRPINYQTILAWINQKKLAPIYLFLGEEEYQKEEIIYRIKKLIFPTSQSLEFNYDVFYGDETDASTIIAVANSFPMMHERRMVVIKRGDSMSAPNKKLLASYAEDPANFTCLIFLANKLEAGNLLYKAVMKKGTVVMFYPLFDNQAVTWVQAKCEQRAKKKISTSAATLFVQRVGVNLQLLTTELEKLFLLTGNKPTIEEEDIIHASGDFHEENIFSLIDAIGYRKKTAALTIFKKLMDRGEEPLHILYMITRHFRLLWQAKELQEQGKPLMQISTALNIKFKKQQTTIWNQLKLFSYDKLKRIFELLLETDVSLKSQDYKTHSLIMELLIVKIC